MKKKSLLLIFGLLIPSTTVLAMSKDSAAVHRNTLEIVLAAYNNINKKDELKNSREKDLAESAVDLFQRSNGSNKRALSIIETQPEGSLLRERFTGLLQQRKEEVQKENRRKQFREEALKASRSGECLAYFAMSTLACAGCAACQLSMNFPCWPVCGATSMFCGCLSFQESKDRPKDRTLRKIYNDSFIESFALLAGASGISGALCYGYYEYCRKN